jgi:hypothetical protein
MAHHPAAPVCTICASPGKLVEDDFGYVVVCTNKDCEGVPTLSKTSAVNTKSAAWSYWVYLQTGVCR